ncbi:hypothetical protein PINS_up013528 [Pythium insidiosum]|nr:hypothetical protein PINS_up013528 [Pythium insidiosum]
MRLKQRASCKQTGANNVLVTLGSDGSVFVPSDPAVQIMHQPCERVNNVVDTTGAGDCFRAAFAASVAQGKDIQSSLQFAAAASALCVQVAGAMPSMPTAAATNQLIADKHT